MTQLNVRVDDNVKANAERALNEMGLTLSAAINGFLTKVARERRIPFEVNADPFYSEANIAELERRILAVREGREKLEEHQLIEADDI